MARNSTTGLENRTRSSVFTTPIARAFIARVIARGVTEAQARKIYSDYLRKSRPASDRRARAAA